MKQRSPQTLLSLKFLEFDSGCAEEVLNRNSRRLTLLRRFSVEDSRD
ncbi:hypothetical protein BH695_2315 [Microcystis aeruginosa PCC 7806SL]|uniref:Uncharacterized protein n=1 Tax=Microcystis aeruginosa PCC 7806SL TaxID=1903187 RepID=A0AB33BTP8_MICA7|nr:hypothetical protein BH695_2315 [Microcystis aeruginosa PCC 7806SL]